MEEFIVFDPNLTKQDRLVLENLSEDLRLHDQVAGKKDATPSAPGSSGVSDDDHDGATVSLLKAMNNAKDSEFEPTIFATIDYKDLQWKPVIRFLERYSQFAQSVVRVETDVIMFTHLLLYFTTSVPSAIYLFYNFSWAHGIVHTLMQLYYLGPYTLMMHQHIHMRGILRKQFGFFDHLFPYVLDPLMGHTWNAYYFHHVKHHHVEGNGPGDLSSTLRFQRDNIWHFMYYAGRFLTLIWFDLPLYFYRTRKYRSAAKSALCEYSYYAAIYLSYKFNPNATIMVFMIPLLAFRIGAMVGNWAQHAFINFEKPDCDYRSSVTLIDVSSNRFSFNDGYHTSHHLNPRRHWREHPVSFLKNKKVYAEQEAIVFHNIDYIMITIKLMLHDYEHLAKCMVPITEEQMAMSLEERMAFLKDHTRQFSEQEITAKFKAR